MKRNVILAVVASVTAPLLLYAAMTTAAAKKRAVTLWGASGCVTTIDQAGKGMVKSVGLCPQGCAVPYVEYGRAPSDFSAAFAAAAWNSPLIHGPFKGQVPLHIVSTDDTEIGSIAIIVDGQERVLTPTLPVGKLWDLMTTLDTTSLSAGIHTLCKKVVDKAGNSGLSGAVLFRVDQLTGYNVEWAPPTEVFRLKPPYQPGPYAGTNP